MSTNDARYDKYLSNLPVIPDVAVKVMAMTDSQWDVSFEELEGIIKVDPSLTAKILKIANSALYARQREITNVQRAIALLGLKNIRSLVMLVAASNLFRRSKGARFYQDFWRHSIYTAFLAKHMCTRIGISTSAETAFLGGVLHDIGQAALFNTDPEAYERVVEGSADDADSLIENERNVFGVDHRVLGATAFRKWSFPQVYVDIALEHGGLNIVSPHKQVIIVVSVASNFIDMLGFGRSAGNEELLENLLSHLSLDDADMQYYRTQFLTDIRQDTLFRQCSELFGIE